MKYVTTLLEVVCRCTKSYIYTSNPSEIVIKHGISWSSGMVV